MLENRFFLDIIKHKHFTPRLIEWLSMHTRVTNVPPEGYRAHISELLKSPETIWSHAFHNQISSPARQALLALYTAGEWVETGDLEPAFIALRRYCAAKYNERTIAGDFRRALQELDGAFLSYSSGHAFFLNPSIREFVASVIARDRDTAEDLIASASRFKQVVALWKLAQAHPENALATVLKAEQDLLFDVLSRLLPGPSLRWERVRDGSLRGHYIDMGVEARIGFIIEVAAAHQSSRLAELAVKASERLAASWCHNVPEFQAVRHLFETIGENTWFLSRGGHEIYRTLLDDLMNKLSLATATDWLAMIEFPNAALNWTEIHQDYFRKTLKAYCASGVKDEISNCTTLDEMSDLKDSLETLVKKYELDLGSAIRKLDEEIKERQEREEREELEEPTHDDDQPSFRRGRSITYQEMMSDDDVSQMFNTLRNTVETP